MRKICIVLILSQVAFLGACQSEKSNDQELVIPMDMTSRRPVVEVTLDGKGPYKFIFDTGSGTNVIDEALNKELGFRVVGSDSLKTQGAARLVSERVAVPKVTFPNTEISRDSEMSVVNLRGMLPIDGVLSGGFFEDKLVTMDYPGSKLIVRDGILSENDPDVSKIIENPRVLSYDMEVAGITVEAHLDTGSPGGFSLPYSLKDRLKFIGKITKGQEIRTPVASYQPWHAKLLGTIKVGGVEYQNPDVVLVEGFDYANLGYAVVKDLRTTIDRKNNLIKFEKSTNVVADTEDTSTGEENEYTGWYGGKVRRVFLEEGEMYLERGQFKLKLELQEGELYKMVYHIPVNNELPNVRFERDNNGQVRGFTFIFEDGREDFVAKD